MIKLIASDMDGTFLNNKGTYDKEHFDFLFPKMKEKGIQFVAASGNRMERLHTIFTGKEHDIDYVAENGALVIDKGETLIRQVMVADDVDAILAFFAGHEKDYRIMLSGKDTSYTHKDSSFIVPDLPGFAIDEKEMREFFNNITFLNDFSKRPQDDITKVTLMVQPSKVEEITKNFNQTFKGKFSAVSSGFGAIDIIQNGIHKAWGLDQLMTKYHISRQEIITFGDGGNDIEMLKFAKYSFAMENAPEYVKGAANYEAPSNNESGVLQVIEKVLSGDIS